MTLIKTMSALAECQKSAQSSMFITAGSCSVMLLCATRRIFFLPWLGGWINGRLAWRQGNESGCRRANRGTRKPVRGKGRQKVDCGGYGSTAFEEGAAIKHSSSPIFLRGEV